MEDTNGTPPNQVLIVARYVKKRWLIFTGVLLIILITTIVVVVHSTKLGTIVYGAIGATPAEQAGIQLSGGNCSGQGPGKLSASAMNPGDFAFMIPYGVMVGGHVTPIDHQYYAPADYNSPRDAYPVYAMGDAHIVQIQHRVQGGGDNQATLARKTDEYRLVFSQSCTFFYYYDLLTSLTPDIKAQFDNASGGQQYAEVDIPVKAAQQVGRIGGQTLDYAVWDTQKHLTGFVDAKDYIGESWKIYVADPLDYYTPELKTLMLSKYIRTVPPISGKIDYDIDGKLIGNWFIEGKTYLTGPQNQSSTPWDIELTFAPDIYDPSHFVISIGNYPNGAHQFYAQGNTPDPATVSVGSGLVKYGLSSGAYVLSDGQFWNQMAIAKNPVVKETSGPIPGVALVQMLENRKIKFEAFPGKTMAEVTAFDSNAKIYTR